MKFFSRYSDVLIDLFHLLQMILALQPCFLYAAQNQNQTFYQTLIIEDNHLMTSWIL